MTSTLPDPNTYGWAPTEGFPEREVATILAGNKNVALMLVEAGYASVGRHQKDDSRYPLILGGDL